MFEISIVGLLISSFVMFFGVTGAANVMGLKFAANAFSSFEDDLGDARVIGALEILAASLLAMESARFWGLALGEFVIFSGITILLYKSRYAHALAGIPLLALLPVTQVT